MSVSFAWVARQLHTIRFKCLTASLVITPLLLAGCGGADGLPANATDPSVTGLNKQNDTTQPGMPSMLRANANGNSDVPADAAPAVEPMASTESNVPVDTVVPPVPTSTQPESPPNNDDPTRTNSVDIMISDMALMNDLPLTGVNPKYGFARGPGYVIMGNDPRGLNTPDWHKSRYPDLVNGDYWNYLLPWFVHFEGDGNQADNTRIQMRNLRVWIKSRATGQWRQTNQTGSASGTQCPHGSNYFHCARSATIRRESDNSLSAMPEQSYNLHGWWGGRERIDGPDVAAVVVTMQARLMLNDTSRLDDRDSAKYLLQIGADYYYTNGSSPTVLPAVGISRAKLVTRQWQSFSMTTFRDVGKQEPGGGVSKDEMFDNPPPLD